MVKKTANQFKSFNKIIKVRADGSINLGKALAGRKFHMEVLDSGQILLTPVTAIPKDHETFFTAEANEQLEEFREWAKAKAAKESE
jgi:hypothetical protein